MQKTKMLCLSALFTALSIVLSQYSIPIGPVPVNFVHTAIFTAAGLLGAKYGTLSQMIFVGMGTIGLPVFSGFSGGFGWLLGPTGGFIVSYIFCALAAGLLIDRYGRSVKVLVPALCAGWVITYAMGISWFIFVTGIGFSAALPLAMLPFLPGDVVKTVLAVILIRRLGPVINKG